MRFKRKNENGYKSMVALDVATLIVLLCVSVFGILVVGLVTWSNADKAGREIANSYCLAEEHNFNTYKNLLEIGTSYVDDMEAQGLTEDEIATGLNAYFGEIRKLAGIDTIEPYAVIENRLIASDNLVDNSIGTQLDYTVLVKQDWYIAAIEADGAVIVTDAYRDMIYGKPVVTLVKKCDNSANVIAIDMLQEDFQEILEEQILPNGSICYVFDSKGTLYYSNEEKGAALAEAYTEYTTDLFDSIRQLDGAEKTVYRKNLNGEKQAVYYRENINGGYCIVTIPRKELLYKYGKLYFCYVIVFLITIGIILRVWIEGYRKRKDNERKDETVQVLGSAYYALYRIHVREGTYENIKGGELLEKDWPEEGNYDDLLAKLCTKISEDTVADFRESFSLENISELIFGQIRDFGGDFQRDFDGEYQWVNVRMLYEPTMSENEVVLCFRKSGEEKQKQLRYVETLKEALEAAQRSENSQKQFFSGMSHDMRTPLNGIIGISKIARRYVEDSAKMLDYLDKINYSSRQLLGLINDILEMSRLEQDIHLENEQFNFKDSVEQCFNVFEVQAEASGKKFVTDYKITNEVVYGDSRRLHQVLNNLLSNALKFTKPGDCIEVKVRELERQKYIRYEIVVSDTGLGMSEDFQKHIFEPYARETRFGSNIEGTGLGMPIVKSIVSQMGGEIAVKSALDEGTVFTIVVPFEPVEDAQEQEKKPSAAIEQEHFTLQDKVILLAEDNELNMEIATDILEMEGVRVVPAWNGREALEKFAASKQYEFSAILMDMQMPEMDGCEAAAAIRALDREDAKSIPIIALTANAFPENVVSSIQAGMNAHIVKPIDVSLLCDTLGRLITEDEKRRQ